MLRVFRANLVLGRPPVNAYASTANVFVGRFMDVREVVVRETDLAVVDEPRIREIAAGENVLLGMQDSPAYRLRRDIVPRSDRGPHRRGLSTRCTNISAEAQGWPPFQTRQWTLNRARGSVQKRSGSNPDARARAWKDSMLYL